MISWSNRLKSHRGHEQVYREGGQGKDHDQHARQLAQANPHPALCPQAIQHLALPPLRIVIALFLHTADLPIAQC